MNLGTLESTQEARTVFALSNSYTFLFFKQSLFECVYNIVKLTTINELWLNLSIFYIVFRGDLCTGRVIYDYSIRWYMSLPTVWKRPLLEVWVQLHLIEYFCYFYSRYDLMNSINARGTYLWWVSCKLSVYSVDSKSLMRIPKILSIFSGIVLEYINSVKFTDLWFGFFICVCYDQLSSLYSVSEGWKELAHLKHQSTFKHETPLVQGPCR